MPKRSLGSGRYNPYASPAFSNRVSLLASRSRSTRLFPQPPIPRLQLARAGHSAPPPELRLVGERDPAPFSWKVLGNLSKVFPLAAPSAALGSRCAPAPRLPGRAARPAVLGRRRFREGPGHGGQKIRRPPRPASRPAPRALPARRPRRRLSVPAAAGAPGEPARERELRPRVPPAAAVPAEPQLRSCRRRCRDMVLCVQG